MRGKEEERKGKSDLIGSEEKRNKRQDNRKEKEGVKRREINDKIINRKEMERVKRKKIKLKTEGVKL